MDTHQCPRCELRFASRPELEDHLREDHPPLADDEPTPPRDAERDAPPTA